MGVVAISETLGSLGGEIGRVLARSLAYEFADREIIAKAAERFGEGVMELAHVTEERPTLWERLADTKRHYLASVEAILFAMAARDNVILSGRGAAFLLGGISHVLRVRITAPDGVRAERVAHQQGLGRDAALALVRQADREQAARIRFLYHVDWEDPLLYDLLLNTQRLSPEKAARLVQGALQDPSFHPSEESRRELADLALVAQVKAALMLNPITRPLQLHLTSKDGVLSLGGLVEQEEQRQVAQEIAGRVPGVARVLSEIVVAPTHRRMPV